MAEDRKTFKIKDGHLGEVKIADEVVAIIAGLAATEVEGVSSMAGNITNELVGDILFVLLAALLHFLKHIHLLRHIFHIVKLHAEKHFKNLFS